MILVVNKGRSTHVITNVTRWERRPVKVGFFHDNDREAIDEALVYFVGDRATGGAVHLSQWDWIYVLMPDLINQQPLSNANWIKRPQ